MKRNSTLVMVGISFTAIIFLGLFPSQALACVRPQYWPPAGRGWRETTPEAQGMNSAKIEEMYNFIDLYDINLHSMLIVRNGYIINEEYLYNSERIDQKSYYWPEANPEPGEWDLRDGRLHCVWSVTKSVVSLLTGIAIEMGLFDLDTKFFDVFPDRWNSTKYGDPIFGDAKKEITVENLLLQNTGIEWIEVGEPSNFFPWLFTGFNLDYYLTQPMLFPPGWGFPYYFIYSSGNQEMLSVMIANRSGMTMADFAQKYLFRPLKILDSEWDWMYGLSSWGTGDLAIKYHGGFGLFMTHRAMAHIGLMCLNDGMWRGKQVVPEDWIVESTSVQIIPGGLYYYGYLWWITPTVYYQAIGYGGQRIIVIPEYDIVVVITAWEFNDWYWYGSPYNHLIEEFIMKAVIA